VLGEYLPWPQSSLKKNISLAASLVVPWSVVEVQLAWIMLADCAHRAVDLGKCKKCHDLARDSVTKLSSVQGTVDSSLLLAGVR
jgi:hypothetical protein